ncbi:MAG: hypothetical protein D6696_17360 [Acidobacteria bacterium]|nr:MAG: hypothetical protein D6696_17360 [Acidobacteriota bacterium]
MPAALAAAALVLLLQPAAHLAPLPAYDLVLHGAVRERRSTAPPASGDEGRIFARGNLFDLQLVPAGEVEGPVAVRVFRDGGSGFEPWTQAAELATIEGGAIRIRGRLGEDLDLPPGEWRLVVAIGRPGELPAAADLRRDETAGGPWVVSEVGRIRIVEEGMIEPGS